MQNSDGVRRARSPPRWPKVARSWPKGTAAPIHQICQCSIETPSIGKVWSRTSLGRKGNRQLQQLPPRATVGRSPTGRAGLPLGEQGARRRKRRDAREDGESRTAATLVAPRHWGCCRHEPRRRPRPSAATPKRAQRPRVGAPATMARTTGARTEASTRSPKTEASPGPSKTEARTEPSLTGRLSSLRSQRTFCPRAFGPSFGGEVGVSTSSRALARLKCPRGAVDGAPYIVGLYKSSRELEPCRSAYRAELPPSRCP
ncbi:unnamed protein product [Prorocentrum cordatum]|uniref:Uncharacterized protein n=1 Tax=Prorocentrum cordatum TaxID=2364126 RepID=A0ABN9RSH2_9DINO|nr:unnamed protein product [Polarella glacialis]